MALWDCHASSMARVRMLPGRPAPPQTGRTLLKGTLIRLRKEKRYLVMPVCSERAGKPGVPPQTLPINRQVLLCCSANIILHKTAPQRKPYPHARNFFKKIIGVRHIVTSRHGVRNQSPPDRPLVETLRKNVSGSTGCIGVKVSPFSCPHS